MTFGASRGSRRRWRPGARGPRARAVGRPYEQGVGARRGSHATCRRHGRTRPQTPAPPAPAAGPQATGSGGGGRGAGAAPRSTRSRWSPATASWRSPATPRRRAAAGLVALAVRFGLHWPPAYVLVTRRFRPRWIAMVALQRGYEARFLGNGPEEYRRATIAAMALFTLIAVTRTCCASDVSRTYVLLAVAALLVLSLAGRHALRTWIYRLRARGQGLQRVLVVGRADAAVAVIEQAPAGAPARAARGRRVRAAGRRRQGLARGRGTGGRGRRHGSSTPSTRSAPTSSPSSRTRTSPASRCGGLSWALEERGVELVVSPGIVEVAGPAAVDPPGRRACRCCTSSGRRFGGAAGSSRRSSTGSLGAVAARASRCRCWPRSPLAVRRTSRRAGALPAGAGRRRRPAVHDAQVPLDGRRTPRHRLRRARGLDEGNGVLFKMPRRPAGHPGRRAAAPVLPRRAAAADQRPARRHVAGRPAAAAARGGRGLRRRRRPPAAGAARA